MRTLVRRRRAKARCGVVPLVVVAIVACSVVGVAYVHAAASVLERGVAAARSPRPRGVTLRASAELLAAQYRASPRSAGDAATNASPPEEQQQQQQQQQQKQVAKSLGADLGSRGLARRACDNTFGSAALRVADSRGAVCDPFSLGPDGCCCAADAEKEERVGGVLGVLGGACLACDAAQCCGSYEHCVACCVAKLTPARRAAVAARASHAALADASVSDWEWCRFKCLTNSGSVLHQNSWRSPRVNCYGEARAPLQRAMSINSDVLPFRALVASVDGSATDPYLARGEPGASNFPCIVEGCAIPDQDRSILENARREERAGDRNAARPRR